MYVVIGIYVYTLYAKHRHHHLRRRRQCQFCRPVPAEKAARRPYGRGSTAYMIVSREEFTGRRSAVGLRSTVPFPVAYARVKLAESTRNQTLKKKKISVFRRNLLKFILSKKTHCKVKQKKKHPKTTTTTITTTNWWWRFRRARAITQPSGGTPLLHTAGWAERGKGEHFFFRSGGGVGTEI